MKLDGARITLNDTGRLMLRADMHKFGHQCSITGDPLASEPFCAHVPKRWNETPLPSVSALAV